MWQKLVVMLSDVLMNLTLSLLCVGITLGAIGYAALSLYLAEASTDSPTVQARVRVGDKIVGIDGGEASDWAAVQRGINRTLPGRPTRIAVQRGPERLELSVTPRGSGGRSVTGVLPISQHYRTTLDDILKYEWAVTVATSKVLVALPVKLQEATLSLFETEKPRNPDSVMGIVRMRQIASQIASTEAPGFTLANRVASLLLMVGSLNLTLFLFDLVPLMPLDEGRIAGAVFKQLRRQWCRLRDHPDPEPVDLAQVLPLTAAMVVAFIGMTVLLIMANIVRPV